MNQDTPYWALRQIEDPKQYLTAALRGISHLLLHKTRAAALDMAHTLGLGEWLEAVEVVPSRLGIFRHFILEAQPYALDRHPAPPNRCGWSQRRLQNVEAYLRHAIKEGRRDVYDAEENRLLWMEVKAEIDRRKEAGQWQQ